jgi:hypothetical protein
MTAQIPEAAFQNAERDLQSDLESNGMPVTIVAPRLDSPKELKPHSSIGHSRKAGLLVTSSGVRIVF